MQAESSKSSSPRKNGLSKEEIPSSKAIQPGQKQIILEYDSDLVVHVVFRKSDDKKLSCEWLLREGLNNLKAIAERKNIKKDFSKVVAFRTKSMDLLIDYWLTLPKMNLTLIEDGTVLVPYFSTKPEKPEKPERKSHETISVDEEEDSSRHARLADFEFLTLLGKGGFSKVFLGNVISLKSA